MSIEKIDEGIFRIKIPFEDLTTTVYVVTYERGTLIIDSATYSEDVDRYILPALKEIGVDFSSVRFLLLTHKHGDHAGGIGRLSECLPHATVGAFPLPDHPERRALSDGEILLGGLRVLYLPGHSQDSVGYLDLKTKTLLSGDCLQLKGVGKYRNGVRYRDAYEESIHKLKGMEIHRIVAAHEYDPLGSTAVGKDAVRGYLESCLEALQETGN